MSTMLPPQIVPVSLDYSTAGFATGYSSDTMRRAVDAGDLIAHYPEIGLRQLAKPVVMWEDLRAWVARGDTTKRVRS